MGETDVQTDRRTDGRARRVMQLIGRPHNNDNLRVNVEQQNSNNIVRVASHTNPYLLAYLLTYDQCLLKTLV